VGGRRRSNHPSTTASAGLAARAACKYSGDGPRVELVLRRRADREWQRWRPLPAGTATGRGAVVGSACYSAEQIMSGGGRSPRGRPCGTRRLCMLQRRADHGWRRRRPQPSETAAALLSAPRAKAAAEAASPQGRLRGAGRRGGALSGEVTAEVLR
jgi:hypothetical protein